jgi:hypothetical protein
MSFDSLTGFASNVTPEAVNITNMTSGIPPETAMGIIFAFLGAFFILFLLMVLFFIVLIVAIYIYSALALMNISKRAGVEPVWLAWIPFANLYLLSKIARMPWWPILLLIPYLLLSLIPYVSIIGFGFFIAFLVFDTIWWWKVFERVGRPGWWAVMWIIPIAGPIIFLVFIGIAAWGKSSKNLKKISK